MCRNEVYDASRVEDVWSFLVHLFMLQDQGGKKPINHRLQSLVVLVLIFFIILQALMSFNTLPTTCHIYGTDKLAIFPYMTHICGSVGTLNSTV